MKKTTWIAALVLATGAGFAAVPSFAHPADCMGGGPMMGQRDGGPMSERMAQRMQQRQKALHDALKLSPEQEGAWTKFQQSQPFAQGAARPDPAEFAKLNAPERAEKMLEAMKKHEDAMTQHVAAMKAFYGQLTPEQKKTFDEQFAAGPRGGRGMRGPGPDGRGPGGPGAPGGPNGQPPAPPAR